MRSMSSDRSPACTPRTHWARCWACWRSHSCWRHGWDWSALPCCARRSISCAPRWQPSHCRGPRRPSQSQVWPRKRPQWPVRCAPLALTGLLGIGYEVLMVRVLSQLAEDTVYTLRVAARRVPARALAAGAAAYRHCVRCRARWRRVVAPTVLRRRIGLPCRHRLPAVRGCTAHACRTHGRRRCRGPTCRGSGDGTAGLCTADLRDGRAVQPPDAPRQSRGCELRTRRRHQHPLAQRFAHR